MVSILSFILAILVGFGVLCWSANRLVEVASTLAFRLGMSVLTIGVTVVAFGTSAPELVVSSVAAFNGSGGIAIGNVVGSNIANIGLILSIGGLIAPLMINARVVYRELLILLVCTIAAAFMLADGTLTPIDGMIFTAAFLAYAVYLLKSSSGGSDEQDVPVLPISTARAAIEAVAMLLLLVLGSQLLVWGAKGVALAMGVNELIVGLTVVALGTSLPELAAVVISARKGLHDMTAATVIGSNIFNILAVLGLSGLLGGPIAVDSDSLHIDMLVMVGITVLLVAVIYSSKTLVRQAGGKGGVQSVAIWKVAPYKCAMLLAAFFAYITWLVISTL
ncbi:calcium/sodium antiporter [Parendozoicomonas haliclonae]|uniref:Inner membrane protein YrbG n=2 Tax=Parendozoicomonas haliclonae TaxID=1960125 RepID=A0A1X7ARH5_9GAMM|nr:Inner membrane protein YrbG [Parendozoicomonas haliclonae]